MNRQQLDVDAILATYDLHKPSLERWAEEVAGWLRDNSTIRQMQPILIKHRLKDRIRLADKIYRKYDFDHRPISPASLLEEVEDLAGVRLVVAHKRQVMGSVKAVEALAATGAWEIVNEDHYVWHPEERMQLIEDGQDPQSKESAYCSRHFILEKPRFEWAPVLPTRCELQIRTVLEEAIFENDHRLRYSGHPGPDLTILTRLAEMLEVADQMLSDAYEKCN